MNKLFKRFGLTNVFDQVSVVDTNTSDLTGGVDDPSKGGGGGGGEAKPSKDQTYEITVDGEKRQVTVEEMRNLAQKAAGADKKFEDASKMKKAGADGLRMQELITRLSDGNHNPTETEIRELAGMIGADPKEFAEYLSGDLGDNDKEGKPSSLDGEAFDKWFTERMGFPPAEARQRLDFSHNRHIVDTKKEIRKMSDEVVDKDAIFGKMKIGENADDRVSVIKDMVAEDVLGRIQMGESFGAELVAASVQKIRAYLTKFGIPGKPDQHLLTLGLGPSGGLPAEITSEEPIQRVSAADPKGTDNFVARYMQRGLKKLREVNRQ